jgi:hypothetical protein
MKRILSLFSLLFLLLLPSVFAQTLTQYILATKGDTLVVKDDLDNNNVPDVLTQLMAADTTNVPAGRVYQLHAGGYYSVLSSPTSSSKVRAIVAGDNKALIKNSQATNAIPIVTGAVYEGSSTKGGLKSGYDLLVKNINCNSGNASASTGDWTFFAIGPVGGRLTVDNCLIEHNIWTEIQPVQLARIFFKNDYFVNLSGHTCCRNGGVIDFNAAGATINDTMWVENCTHVMTQGSLYKFRDGITFNRTVFNHNDFINCSGFVFMNRGTVTNISVTNNIFVNCNVQAYAPILNNADVGEVDPGNLAMGLVNVSPDSALFKAAGGGHFYVDANLVYWDPKLTAAIPSTLNTTKVNGVTNWVSQMITMNARTQAAFNNDATYPYLVEGTWYKQLPTFKNTASLFTTQLASLITYANVCADTTYTGALPYWREVFTATTDFSYSDWPIPVNLSYTDAALLTGGLNKFPVGDLNWFPTQYAAWTTQKTAEYTTIQTALTSGKLPNSVKQVDGLPVSYQLGQNYPNPFNPTTVINYTIPKAGNVSLKVYNLLGQEVATLVNGYQSASKYQVSFNASKLASGIYLYTIKADNFTQTMKMMLMK